MAVDGVVLLDVDGTLVDSNLFHALAWSRAYAKAGHVVPFWKIVGTLGMGGDQVVPELLGDEVEEAQGEAIRASWKEEIEPYLDTFTLLPGARELVRGLAAEGLTVVLASSGAPEHVELARRLLDSDDALHSSTDSDDADTSKPAPDLFVTAWEKTGAAPDARGLVIGDAPADCDAAGAAGLPALCFRTGGMCDDALLGAGAVLVLDDPAEAVARLDEVLALLRPRRTTD